MSLGSVFNLLHCIFQKEAMQGKKKKLRLDIFKGSEFKGHYLKQSLQKRWMLRKKMALNSKAGDRSHHDAAHSLCGGSAPSSATEEHRQDADLC